MPTTVGARAYPAPLDTDPLRDGAERMRELGAAVSLDVVADRARLDALEGRPTGKVALPATIGLPNSSSLTFNMTAEYASVGMRDGSFPTRLIAPIAGVYRVIAQVAYESNSTGRRLAQVRRNAGGSSGSGTQVIVKERAPVSGQRTYLDLTTELLLAAGEYVELFAFQSSGASLDLVPSSIGCYMALTFERGPV